jgi:hypothetical protein
MKLSFATYFKKSADDNEVSVLYLESHDFHKFNDLFKVLSKYGYTLISKDTGEAYIRIDTLLQDK